MTLTPDYLIWIGTIEQPMLILVVIGKLMSSHEMGLIAELALDGLAT